MSEEITHVEQPQLLFGITAVEKAAVIATNLKKIIEDRKLYSDIDGKKYVMVEGWTTLGALLGVVPQVLAVEDRSGGLAKRVLVSITKKKFNSYKRIWEAYEKKMFIDPALLDDTMKVKKTSKGEEERDVKEIKYQVNVGIFHKGQLVTNGIAICSNLEGDKLSNPEYAILSMAQTRATGKAFRLALSWIMQMAGYEVTPWEEMQDFVDKPADAPTENAVISTASAPRTNNVVNVPHVPAAPDAKIINDEIAKRTQAGVKVDPTEVAKRAAATNDFNDADFDSLSKSLGV